MKEKSIKKNIKLKDLKNELQMLLGAKETIEYISSWHSKAINDNQRFGNIVNYYKSCAYLQMRNVFNVLTREQERNPAGGKGVWGEFRPAGSGASSPGDLEQITKCLGFEFGGKLRKLWLAFSSALRKVPLHLTQNMFEQGELCSILDNLPLQVRVPVEVLANTITPNF